MPVPNEQNPVFASLPTPMLINVREELAKIVDMLPIDQPVSPDVLHKLNFESGRRSVLRDIEVEIERRKEDPNVL